MTHPFRDTAPSLMARGYSPIPILSSTKRPALTAWQRACDAPLPKFLVDKYAGNVEPYGVGIALGYRGVVAIDLDTEDPAVIAAVRSVIAPSPVAKAGARGRTDFYVVESGSVPSKRFPGVGGMLVEVLGHGAQTVIPPSLHPSTGAPYLWLGPARLGDVTVENLPTLPADVDARLAAALASWRRQECRQVQVIVTAGHAGPALSHFARTRQHHYVTSILSREIPRLAAMARDTGRNLAVYNLVCRVGRWYHHGILSSHNLVPPILSACADNGLIRDDGRHSVLATIASGLKASMHDPLPDLGARRGRGS